MAQATLTSYYTTRKKIDCELLPKPNIIRQDPTILKTTTVTTKPSTRQPTTKKPNTKKPATKKSTTKGKSKQTDLNVTYTKDAVSGDKTNSAKRGVPPATDGSPTKKKQIESDVGTAEKVRDAQKLHTDVYMKNLLENEKPTTKNLLENKKPTTKYLLENEKPSTKNLLENEKPSTKNLLGNEKSSAKNLLEKKPTEKNLLEKKPTTKGKSEQTDINVICSNDAASRDTSSPKRRLLPATDGTPTKKKPVESNVGSAEKVCNAFASPSKVKCTDARRKLHMDVYAKRPECRTPTKSANSTNPFTSPEKVEALINQSRSKLILSPRLDELKKSLLSFSEQSAKFKAFESNPCKITKICSPSRSSNKTVIMTESPAHRRLTYLSSDESSLQLPSKYKQLSEVFRCVDSVVSILHNRKAKITFEKLQDGVQEMTKRNFTKDNFGQIVTVLPSAYHRTIEKCGVMNKKKLDGSDYQLVITPNLTGEEESNKKSKSVFTPMQPPSLISRQNEFLKSLINIVKKQHQEFLKRINFPSVPEDSIRRWHPKFNLDSVPDILPASLPQPPESKICTAKDVLNRVKGSFRQKFEKAIKSVADESANSNVTLELKDTNSPKPSDTSSNALKGVCSDLLAKIRARESAALLEAMTRSPDQTKRMAKLERLPKIINILWLYFIAERKAALPVDVAVEKITHSFNSLMTPDDVKEHLKLITEEFPGWLNFIEMRKSQWITIDKKKNINEMLRSFKH